MQQILAVKTWRFVPFVLVASLAFVEISRCALFSFHVGNLLALNSLFKVHTISSARYFEPHPYVAAVLDYRRGNYESAEELFPQAFKSRYVLSRWYLIQALNRMGDWRSVLEIIDVTSPLERSLFLEVLFDNWEFIPIDLRHQYEEEIIRQYPDTIIGYASRLMGDRQEFEKAIYWATQVPRYSESIPARILVGQAHYYLRQYSKAETIFSDLIVETRQPVTLYWHGKVLSNTGRANEATELFEEALRQNSPVLRERLLVDLVLSYAKSGNCTKAGETRIQYSVQMDMKVFQEYCD